MWLLLKNLLFTVLVPGFVAGWVPVVFLLHRAPLPAAWTLRHFAALPLFAVGATFYFACLWLFGAYGHGTPAPIDPPKKLVMRGPYRWVRYYDDVLLVDIYSGEVVDVIHDFFW